jgi:hypothetical protein
MLIRFEPFFALLFDFLLGCSRKKLSCGERWFSQKLLGYLLGYLLGSSPESCPLEKPPISPNKSSLPF